MISFLTNEHIPERLKIAMKELRKERQTDNANKKDKVLILLGSLFVSGLAGVITLFVYYFN